MSWCVFGILLKCLFAPVYGKSPLLECLVLFSNAVVQKRILIILCDGVFERDDRLFVLLLECKQATFQVRCVVAGTSTVYTVFFDRFSSPCGGSRPFVRGGSCSFCGWILLSDGFFGGVIWGLLYNGSAWTTSKAQAKDKPQHCIKMLLKNPPKSLEWEKETIVFFLYEHLS